MSLYSVFLILLPIAMVGVLAMPDHHHKPTPHRRPQHHGHSLDHLAAGHPIEHHLDELHVLSLEEPQNEHKRHQRYIEHKRNSRHSEHESKFVLEEDDLEKHFKTPCGYTVEMVPCTGNNCTKQYLRHIKCNHTGQSHGNGYCIQTFRKVQMNCTGSSEKPTHLYTGCVFAKQIRFKELESNNNNQ